MSKRRNKAKFDVQALSDDASESDFSSLIKDPIEEEQKTIAARRSKKEDMARIRQAKIRQYQLEDSAKKKKLREMRLYDFYYKRNWFAVIFDLGMFYTVFTCLLGIMIYVTVWASREVHMMAGVLVAFGWTALIIFVTACTTFCNRKKLGTATPWVPALSMFAVMMLFMASMPACKGFNQSDWIFERAHNMLVLAPEAAPLNVPAPPNRPTFRISDYRVASEFVGIKVNHGSRTYCLAPIVRRRTPEGGNVEVSFWMIGDDCCIDHYSFHCKGWDIQETPPETAWLQLDPADQTKQEFSVAKADAMKRAGTRITDAAGSNYVRYTASQLPEAEQIQKESLVLIYAVVFGWPVVLLALVAILGVGRKGVSKVRRRAAELKELRELRNQNLKQETTGLMIGSDGDSSSSKSMHSVPQLKVQLAPPLVQQGEQVSQEEVQARVSKLVANGFVRLKRGGQSQLVRFLHPDRRLATKEEINGFLAYSVAQKQRQQAVKSSSNASSSSNSNVAKDVVANIVNKGGARTHDKKHAD